MFNQPSSLGPSFAKSAIVHAAAFALIWGLVASQEHTVRQQERKVMADVLSLERAEVEEARQAAAVAAKELLQEQVQQELQELIREQVRDQPDAKALTDLAEQDVKRALDQAEAQKPIAERDQQDRDALRDRTRQDALDRLQKNAEQRKQQDLLALVHDFVHDQAAPDIKRKIERELKENLGEAVKREMQRKAEEQTRNAKGNRGEAQKELGKAAIAGLADKLKAEIAKNVADKAIPLAADKITKALDNHLKDQRLDQGDFKAKVEQEIRSALKDGLGQQPVDAGVGLNKAKDQFGDTAAPPLDAARKALAAAAEHLRLVATSEEQFAATVTKANSEASGPKQEKILNEVKAAVAEGLKAVDLASNASAHGGGAFDNARNMLTGGRAAEAADSAAKNLFHGVFDNAQGNLAQASSELRKDASALDQLASELAKQTDAIAKAAADAAAKSGAAADLAKSLGGEAQAQSAVGAVNAAGGSAIASQAAGAVASGAQNVDTRGLSNQLNQAESQGGNLGQLNNLLDKLNPSNQAGADRATSAVASMTQGALQSLLGNGQGAGDDASAGSGDGAGTAGDGAGQGAGDGAGTPGGDASGATSGGLGGGAGLAVGGAQPGGASGGNGGGAGPALAGAGAGKGPGGVGGGYGQGDPNAAPGGRGHAPGVGSMQSDFRNSQTVRFNKLAYEAFVRDVLERTNPNNFYGNDAETAVTDRIADAIDSVALTSLKEGPAIVYLPAVEVRNKARKQQVEEALGKAGGRKVPLPTFAYKAFAAAPMQEHRLTIDGDLSDWGELTNPITMQYGPDSMEKVNDGPTLWMRWSPDGLYFAYKVIKDPATIQANPNNPYEGDCLELFLDMDNSRKESMNQSQFSHQFCFDPFGFKGDTRLTLCEIGRGMRGIAVHTMLWRDDGSAAAKRTADGYTVEGFLPRLALAKRKLIPGEYLAVNFSINRGTEYQRQRQWSASKIIKSWDKPDTWGDVLLLGSDADANFVASAGRTSGKVEYVVPGDPLAFEVIDRDMNISPNLIDRVPATIRVKGSRQAPLLVVLRETGPNTGIFRGSMDTQSYVLPFRPNTLNVRGGDVVELTYIDARAAYGEANREVRDQVEVAMPVVVMRP